MRHVKMGDARTSQRPSGRLQIKKSGGTDDVVSAVARTLADGHFASTRTPARLIHYNPDFRSLSSEAMVGDSLNHSLFLPS